MQLQRSLAELLYDCYDELVIDSNPGLAVSHGYRRGLSIVTNAVQHRSRTNVLNLDLENFFGSINFGRVRGYFIQSSDFKLHKNVATVIAQIACHENCLPTGSPSSPVISNLIARVLDIRLVRHAKRLGCTYTRYVDDLTFSSNRKMIPADLAAPGSVAHEWMPGRLLTREISRAGFTINMEKTRLQYENSRQEVTGLSVNRRVNTTSTYRRYAMAMVNTLFRTGAYHFPKANEAMPPVPGTVAQLRGIFGFIHFVDRKVLDSPDTSEVWLRRTKAYRRLVFFDDFYLSAKPVLLVEGKTDRIYLRTALHRRSHVAPTLVAKGKSGEIELAVRLYGGSRQTSSFFGLDGGTPALANFIRNYDGFYRGFGVLASENPTIIIVDFDDGIKSIKDSVKKYNVALDDSKPFQWICHDLYIVCIPKKGAMIEDLFDNATRQIKLDGKTFNPTNKAVGPNEYGKSHFASHVIRPNYKTIDFSGFDQLLQNIEAAIVQHAKSLRPS
jgi:RNA-directed DNA polymerase